MEMIGDRWCLSSSNVMERKAAWLDHVIRHSGLAAAVVDGFPEGDRLSVGRPKMCWVNNIREWSGCNIAELKTAALERRVVSKAAVVVPVVYNLRR